MAFRAAHAGPAAGAARDAAALAFGHGEGCSLKVGILGGTFDPVHNAHLAMARSALDQLGLERIVWIPTGDPDYRTPAVASGEQRLTMLAAALGSDASHEIDPRELMPGTSGYTVDTLKELKLELGPGTELWLIIGADQWAKFDSWHRPDEVRKLANIAVVARPGWQVRGARVKAIAFQPMNVSASDIRARVARGEDISQLVPAAVANYIAEKGLYR